MLFLDDSTTGHLRAVSGGQLAEMEIQGTSGNSGSIVMHCQPECQLYQGLGAIKLYPIEIQEMLTYRLVHRELVNSRRPSLTCDTAVPDPGPAGIRGLPVTDQEDTERYRLMLFRTPVLQSELSKVDKKRQLRVLRKVFSRQLVGTGKKPVGTIFWFL
jgi:hypothetical protein